MLYQCCDKHSPSLHKKSHKWCAVVCLGLMSGLILYHSTWKPLVIWHEVKKRKKKNFLFLWRRASLIALRSSLSISLFLTVSHSQMASSLSLIRRGGLRVGNEMGDTALLLWKKHGCNLAYWLWIFLCNARVITSLNNIRFVLESVLQWSSGRGSIPHSGETRRGSLLNEYHHPWHSMGLKFYVSQKRWKRWHLSFVQSVLCFWYAKAFLIQH